MVYDFLDTDVCIVNKVKMVSDVSRSIFVLHLEQYVTFQLPYLSTRLLMDWSLTSPLTTLDDSTLDTLCFLRSYYSE